MKSVTVQCPGCGADLPPTIGTVQCQYCGKEIRLKETRDHRVVVQVPQQRVSKAPLIAIAAISVLGVGIAGVVAMMAASGSSDSQTITVQTSGSHGGLVPTPASSGQAETAATNAANKALAAVERALGGSGIPMPMGRGSSELDSRICLLDDVNGDGVGELSGLVSQGDREKMPTMIDGANGSILWQGEPLGDSSDVHLLCVGPRWLAAVDNDRFELFMANAQDTTKQVRRALSDELDRYGFSDDCIAFKTEDRNVLGLSQEDGSEARCSVRRPRRRPHIADTTTCGIISTLRRGASFENDDVTFRLKARRPGTPFLIASAKRGRRELWEIPLRLVPVSGEAIGCFVGAAAPGVFVVLGAPRGDDHAITVLGLNADAGTERYSVDLPGNYGRVREIHYNGRFVVMGLLRKALAIDPATGQTAWQLGG